jgi:hypothetical protein
MNHKRFWVAASIIALVVIIGFALSVPHTRDIAQSKKPEDATTMPVVSLHDSFKKGVHTITGSLQMPNACTIVNADATVSGDASSTQKILVDISMPADVGVCLQLPTQANFSVTVSAPAHLPISATVNGILASTTVL